MSIPRTYLTYLLTFSPFWYIVSRTQTRRRRGSMSKSVTNKKVVTIKQATDNWYYTSLEFSSKLSLGWYNGNREVFNRTARKESNDPSSVAWLPDLTVPLSLITYSYMLLWRGLVIQHVHIVTQISQFCCNLGRIRCIQTNNKVTFDTLTLQIYIGHSL